MVGVVVMVESKKRGTLLVPRTFAQNTRKGPDKLKGKGRVRVSAGQGEKGENQIVPLISPLNPDDVSLTNYRSSTRSLPLSDTSGIRHGIFGSYRASPPCQPTAPSHMVHSSKWPTGVLCRPVPPCFILIPCKMGT